MIGIINNATVVGIENVISGRFGFVFSSEMKQKTNIIEIIVKLIIFYLFKNF